jgi:hypothetical protein
MSMKTIAAATLAVMMFSVSCYASIRTVGKGDSLSFDPSMIPSSLKSSYNTMKVRCVKCHTLERTVVAITTGIAPITGQPFDRGATRAYGTKMLRKPDSNMNKQEVKAVVDLMNYLIDEAAR